MRAFLLLAILLLLLPGAAAEISIEITDEVGNYSPSQPLSGNAKLVFDELILQDSVLRAYINDQLASSLSMQEHMNPPSSYAFIKHSFGYNLSAEGANTWFSFLDQTFDYEVRVYGTCGSSVKGGCYNASSGQDTCLCPEDCSPMEEPYPCYWEATFKSFYSSSPENTINGDDGLKFIYDIGDSVSPPGDSNDDTVWEWISNSNTLVDLANQQACGEEYYESYWVFDDGWVRRTISKTEFQEIEGTPHKEAYIEGFNHESLSEGTDFNGGPGGIYRDGIHYQSFSTSPLSGPDDFGAYWNGSLGYIKIFNYDSDANYNIIYLPPNGPRLCAFTDSKESGSQEWEESAEIIGLEVDYKTPYSKQYSPADVISILQPPDCPFGSDNCEQAASSYSAYKIHDPDNVVDFSWDSGTLTAGASTDSRELAQTYTTEILLSSFPGLKAPSTGTHALKLSLVYQGAELSFGESGFSSCKDSDGDGFCPEGGDCDDSDPASSPLGNEVCDGKDNDCDGEIDEDFWSAGSKLGSPCGVGLCSGVFVCTPGGQDVVCSNKYYPGELPEYCNDGVDNDCDGVTDESVEIVQGKQVKACICKDGQTKPCGSNIGECKEGISTCKDGMWGVCKSNTPPAAEACNQKDDDCDGVVDNLLGGNSIEATACQCYAGGNPKTEECNEIDDNCDSQVDEGVACCTDGEKRNCGTSLGACEKGVQTCYGESWGSCKGSIDPKPEECFNQADDDCDGIVDEGCEELLAACTNEIQDPGEEGIDCGGLCPNVCGIPDYILIFAAVVIVVIAALAFLQFHPLKHTAPI